MTLLLVLVIIGYYCKPIYNQQAHNSAVYSISFLTHYINYLICI